MDTTKKTVTKGNKGKKYDLPHDDTAQKNLPVDVNDKAKKGYKHKKKIDEYTLENDIKYRGPLSYRGLRVIAWICFLAVQIGFMLGMATKFSGWMSRKVGKTPEILKSAQDVMMPLFLISAFATILNGSKSFKSMLMLYGGASIAVYLLFILVHNRYIPALIQFALSVDKNTAIDMLDGLLSAMLKDGYMAFNVFIDLFLCTLLFFFLAYKPKRFFVGKKEIIFRLFVVFPVVYEITSFIIKLLAVTGKITVSPYLYPLLTTKPPMTFLVFVAIAYFLKRRERFYRKSGKTHEEYTQFLKTNANSWHFSKYTARIMVIAAVVDVIIFFILTVILTAISVGPNGTEEAMKIALEHVTNGLRKIGVGNSGALILTVPFVLLFSYTRTHKHPIIDALIPIITIIVLVFIYIETSVALLNRFSLERLISRIFK